MSHSSPKAPRYRIATDSRLFLLVLASALPTLLLLAYFVASASLPMFAKAAIAVGSVLWVSIFAASAREQLVHHVRTISNLIEAIRTEDYSLKSTRAREPGELAELYQQINALTEKLKTARQGEQELLNILEKVVDQIDVAIIACDADDRIRLVNQLATKLLRTRAEALVGLHYSESELAQVPLSSESRLIDYKFPGGEGRWQITQQHYRHLGRPSRIVFIADLKQVLSEEEIIAWQRLIRVIAHEVNNSLTPITSICQTLEKILTEQSSKQSQADVREGLHVIAERAKGLKEFISVYARIARLPDPQKVLFPATTLVDKLKSILAKSAVDYSENVPDIQIFGDPVHLEQVLINVLKNAIEANKESTRPVKFGCALHDGFVEFRIADNGKGISNPDNLFIPFYTTKSQGAGIGLVLCRQILAKHGGQVSLDNRPEGGALATVKLPLPTFNTREM